MIEAIVEYPFLLALAAALFAEGSAILLRRVASGFGRWIWVLAALLSVLSLVGVVWSFAWAVRERPVMGVSVGWLPATLGSVALLTGLVLTVWALTVVRRRAFYAWPNDRLETRPPYHYIRRPIGLGMTLFSFGVALIVNARSIWVWFVVWWILAQLLFELEEWEIGFRIPSAQVYFERTPRYLPKIRPNI
jgi:hypothetical protein